ncbi:MAG: hypothetical protein JSV62_10625 [Promethearchaeota archaeon]|nr:MAG: hypothetical protein JSV62_10625 [Candidatus Lokiarchaeota archaeon]
MIFFDLLFEQSDVISCILIDQYDNEIFSKKRDYIAKPYDIELMKLYNVIKLLSEDFKILLDYQTKIQTIFCSEINNREDTGFFLLIKSFYQNKKLIAVFPITTSHNVALDKFKKLIELLSYYLSELEYSIIG